MTTTNNKSIAIIAVLAICCSAWAGVAMMSEDSDAATEYTKSWTVGKALSNESMGVYPGPCDQLTCTGSVPGVTFNAVQNGVMGIMQATGTPTTAGTYIVNTYVSGTLTYVNTIVVSSSNTNTSVAWTVGQNVNEMLGQFPASVDDVTFEGSVPGITFSKAQNQQNVVVTATGTPTTKGTYTVITHIGTAQLTTTVTVILPATSADQYIEESAEVGKAFSFGHPWLEYQSGNVPGCTINNPVTGGMLVLSITGTPTTAGTYTILAKTVTDFDTPTQKILSGTVFHIAVKVTNGSFTHTVHYDANGGTGAPADTVVTDSTNGNSTVTLSGSQPTRSGYTFAGWYTAASGGSKVTSVSVGANATTTVYAHWTQNTLSIGSVAKQYAVAGSSVSFAGSCTSSPSGASVSYSATNVQSGLTVNISGNTVTCSASAVGTYTFTLNASATNYSGSSTTVTVQFVPVLAFSNSPSAGALNA